MKDLKDFDNQIFDDKYFENLYENIMKRIEGKIVCIRDMFILENEFLDSECVQVESLKSYNKVNKFLQKLLFG